MDRFISKVVDKVTGDDDDDKKQTTSQGKVPSCHPSFSLEPNLT